MFKKILVPLDGSKRAEAIVPYVEELAQAAAATVVFLQVVESYSIMATSYGPMELFEEAFQQKTNEAESYLNRLRGEFREKGIKSKQCVEHGPVVEAIINVAGRESADLIAMASHGRGGLTRVFYGSVAAGVLQRVDRPLLLVRSREDARDSIS